MSAKPTSRNSGGGHPADPAISECGESERHRLPSDCVNTQRNVLRECIESLQRLTTRDWSRGSQQSVPRDFQQREQIQRKEGRGDSQRLQNDCPGPSEQPVPGDRGSVQLKTSTDGEGIPQEPARGEHQQERLVLLSDMNLPTTSTTSMVSTRRRRRGPAPPPLSASLQLSHHLQPPWTDYRNAPAATNTTANTFHSAAAQEEVEDELDIQVRFFTPNDDVFDPDPPPQDSLREITTFPERCSRCLSAGGSDLPPVSPGRRSPRTVLLKRNSSSLQPISEQEMLTLMERTDLQEALSVLPPCQCDACQLKEAESLSSSSSSSSLSSLTVAAVAEGEGNCPGGAGVCDQLAGVSSSVPALSPPPAPPTQPTRLRRQSSWKKIRSIIRWSPFIQVFKKHRYPWIQLAGHQGNFQAGEAGSVLKKLDSREHQSFQRLMNDRLQPYVPEFRGVVEKNGERYVQLQDLLCEFSSPCVMDIKMGVRTYLEEELTKARKKPTMRKDMYQKMVDVDSNAPTAEEHAQRAVTKPRYMQWRDQMSSSVDLGFRIEGIKKSDGASSKDFKKTKSRDSVADILKAFIGDDEIVLAKYLKRLREISATQESSEFFQSHEVVGSSLLFVHDGRGEVNVWMIDFGKTEPLPKGVVINHRATWVEGNHEDGYLFGLDNIISMLEEMQASSMV